MILLHAIVAALYAIAAWARWPRETAISAGAERAAAWLIPVALALHAAVIAHAIFTPEGLDLSLAHALSLVAGLSVLIAWGSGVLATLPRVGAVLLPAPRYISTLISSPSVALGRTASNFFSTEQR